MNKLTQEERLQTGLWRVVRHVKLFWNCHELPFPYKTAARYFRAGEREYLSEYLDKPPLCDEVVSLVRSSGAVFLIPKAVWDPWPYERKEALRQSMLNTPQYKRKKKVGSKRGSAHAKSDAHHTAERIMHDAFEIAPTLKMGEIQSLNEYETNPQRDKTNPNE